MRSAAVAALLILGLSTVMLAGPPAPGPEIDIRLAGSALTLLTGVLLLRKRR